MFTALGWDYAILAARIGDFLSMSLPYSVVLMQIALGSIAMIIVQIRRLIVVGV